MLKSRLFVAAAILSIFAMAVDARAVPCGSGNSAFCAYYLLPSGFHNLFDTHRIAFDVLPNGQPSVGGTLITLDFNWTDQGVTFSPGGGALGVSSSTQPPFFSLVAANVGVPFNQRNWIAAALAPSARAVAITAPGLTTIYAYDGQGALLGAAATDYFSPFQSFVGIASDTAIARVRIDRGANSEVIDEFQFTPIPEPATSAPLAAGALALIARIRRWPA